MDKKISAIILAGGQGRRMNYQDKGLLKWRDRPLLAHVIDSIHPHVDQIIVNCNQHIDQYRRFGHPVCTDKLSDFQGPLAGVQSALTLAEHPLALICPCDTPALPDNLVDTLKFALCHHNSQVAYPETAEHAHYLPALIRSDVLSSLNAYLTAKHRSVKGWYALLDTIAVHFDTEEEFMNINSADLL